MEGEGEIRGEKILSFAYICFPLFFHPPVVAGRAPLRFLLPLLIPPHPPPRSFLFPLFLVPPSRSFFLALLPFFPSLSARRARTPRPFLFHPRLKMWHSTGLLRCLRWCGIRAGLPRRGVHRGNDAQIGRIISKTTTLRLQPSSYYRSSPLISLSLSLSHSLPVSLPLSLLLSPLVAGYLCHSRARTLSTRRRPPGMEYNPHFRHCRRTTTLPPLPATVPDDE